jgi:hypothetical protein
MPEGTDPLTGFGQPAPPGCYNTADPDWCLCVALTDPNTQDCFENYEYYPEGFPAIPEECDPDVYEEPFPGYWNENGRCGGLFTFGVADCVPVENPLP